MLTPLIRFHRFQNPTDGQSQLVENRAHRVTVAFGQIVVDSYDMASVPRQCPQKRGHRGRQCLSFAGLHFGNVAFEQGDGSHDLYFEVLHLQHATSRLPHKCVGFRQQLVQSRSGFGFPTQLAASSHQFVISERIHLLAAANNPSCHGTPARSSGRGWDHPGLGIMIYV